MDHFRGAIATKILNNIPPYVKPIDYLMESLNISRESVYRRIRGDISFALEEVAKLSVELGFSTDELIMKDMPSRVFFDLHHTNVQNPSDIFVASFQQYTQGVFDMPRTKDIELTMIVNHIPYEFIIFFNQLFKFSYYRWMHQNQESSLKYFYSDVVLPDKLIYLQQKTSENLKTIQNNTFIFDSNIFLNLIHEIQYYYKRKLIKEEDFMLLKEDLLRLVDMVESVAQTGTCGSSYAHYNFYLSSLNINSSSRYIKYDEQIKSQFFVNLMTPMTITNSTLCDLHKKWLDSAKKYSTLITQSNEILQVRYFDKQRVHVNNIAIIPNGYSL